MPSNDLAVSKRDIADRSPLMGLVRGIERNSEVHTIRSTFIPLYGFAYFWLVHEPSASRKGLLTGHGSLYRSCIRLQ